jgi:phosphate transport system protein
MERQFDSQLVTLKGQIMAMGGVVEKALDQSIQALIERDSEGFKKIHQAEEKINQEHVSIDNNCVSFFARQSPLAKDLRLIVSIIKINSDLERMGDQCVNIAYTGKDFLQRNVHFKLTEIRQMSEIVRKMVKDALDSFVTENHELAKEVIRADDKVDELKNQVFREFISYIQTHPQNAEAALDLILIARNLERLGDHATNIAEDVIYVTTGKDIRHGGKFA